MHIIASVVKFKLTPSIPP